MRYNVVLRGGGGGGGVMNETKDPCSISKKVCSKNSCDKKI